MTNPAPTVTPVPSVAEVVQSVLIKGDLSKLTPQERVNYYNAICRSVGLNPLTRPFEYMWLSGAMVLYARKDCAEQLRRIHNISLEMIERKMEDGILSMRVRARLPLGKNGGLGFREDEDIGAVSFPDTVKGDIRANLVMKCMTKAKRRATLSICGLGYLDEYEVETIPGAKVIDPAVAESATFPPDRKEKA